MNEAGSRILRLFPIDSIACRSALGKCLMSGTRSTKRMAFTLVELVVVISTIAILASLSLAVANHANEAARVVMCGSNMRQLGLAATMYSLDNRNRLPDIWQWLQTTPGDVTTGKLYPYTQCKPVYFCPSDKPALGLNPGRSSGPSNSVRPSSYAMNCILCHASDMSRFTAPARTLLLMEPNLAPQDVLGVVGPVPWMGTSNNIISSRHTGFGHVLFCDSHFEKIKTVAAEKLESSNRFWLPAPSSDSTVMGFVSGLPDP